MRMHSPIHHFSFFVCVSSFVCHAGDFVHSQSRDDFFRHIRNVAADMLDGASENNGPVLSLALPTKWKRFVFHFFLYLFFPQEKVIPRFLFLFIKKQTRIVFPQKKSDRITLRETQPDCL